MNKIIRLSIALIFTLFISSPSIATDGDYGVSTKAGPDPGNLISMDFQDANLKTVLKVFSQQSGLNFVASGNVVDKTVTIYFDGVTVEDALNNLMDANNLVYEQEPSSNIFIVKESGAPDVETLTKIYELKYAQLIPPPTEEGEEEEEAEILLVIQGILSENGKVIADKRSNCLIITDVPAQFAIIEDVLARLDVRTPQVMIELEILETTTAVTDKLGIDWTGAFGLYTGPIADTVWPLRGKFSKGSTDPSVGEGIATGTVNLRGMTATLYAILTDTDTTVLARPKILTMNNTVAKIELSAQELSQSKTESITQNDVTTSGLTYEEKDTGVILEVTPQISKDGYVTMHIKPNVTTLVSSRYTDQYDTNTRSTETTVMVKDGETVVIGGLIRKVDMEGFEKIPFLGDIPLLGMAFRYKSTENTDKELIIFITPHIVKDTLYALGRISDREQEKPKVVREKKIRTVLDLLGGG